MSILSFWKERKRKKELREFQKHARYILHVNDDILPKSTKTKVEEVLTESESIDPADEEKADKFLDRAGLRVAKILPKKSYPTIREYADIFAVALCVAFGIRALFLQPFKIPTSSMQPTLFGIHYIKSTDKTLPHLPSVLHYLLFSTQRAKCVIEKAGYIAMDPNDQGIEVKKFTKFLFFPWSAFNIAGINYELPGTPDQVNRYALKGRLRYREGEQLCDGWLSLGDHLFVDRFTYHFREPRRGDVLVFNTEKIFYRGEELAKKKGYYYIKRLVGLPGDTIRLVGIPGDTIRLRNMMVYIKPAGFSEFKPITELNPAFKKVYSLKGGYHGHTLGPLTGHLSSVTETFEVPADSYFALGDNSANSLDSRFWGVVPRKNIVGRGYFVFWPFSRRWGFVDTAEPLSVPTTIGLPSMNLQ